MARTAGFNAPGDAAAKLTTNEMRKNVRRALLDREFVAWARDTMLRVAGSQIRARDWRGVALAIRRYVQQRILFTPDPVGIEDLTTPLRHMELLRNNPNRVLLGDCDDAASLSAALGSVVGIPAEFVVRAFWKPNSPYQHIFTNLYPRGGGVIDMDTTRDAQKFPPTPTREFRVKV